MTFYEAIKHAEELAEKNEKQASWFWGKEGNPKYENCVERAKEHRQLAEWLKELKQLREQTRWIPCSEKLPKKGKQVLCCNKYGSVFTSELTWSKGYLKFGQHYDVIAWQPLPQPYRAGSEG